MNRLIMGAGGALKKLGFLAGALTVAGGVTVAAQAAQYVPVKAITLPGGVKVTSFDIGYVDTTLGMYYLAERDLKGVLAVNTSTNKIVWTNTSLGGTNGVVTVNHTQVWAGANDGTIKVLNARTGALITTIQPPVPVTVRADEACWDPSHNVVLWEWPDNSPPFVAFYSTVTHKMLKMIKYDGSQGPNATDGIEQCQWDARTNLIYDNVPEVNGDGNNTQPGQVVVLNGGTRSIVKAFTIPLAQCTGPQGMAIGPRNEIGINCSRNGATGVGTGSVVINERTGAVLYHFPTLWGGDEMYYDAGGAHYVLTESNDSPPVLGFVNAAAGNTVDQVINTSKHEHSVAADSFHRQVYFPEVAGASNPLCSSLGGDDSLGCIVVFHRQ